MIFNDERVYQALKWIAMILLPAIITLYAALGEVWELPYVAQITATLGAIDAFMGALLKKSSDEYQKLNSEN